ncbi:hypothetical protein DL96DRAFT_614797 [Flagelloscypha sp. PMI_526]|nr:hypothetical protein DL96DRAFT_614797 [Flagelloscypha sp. PMI_526]
MIIDLIFRRVGEIIMFLLLGWAHPRPMGRAYGSILNIVVQGYMQNTVRMKYGREREKRIKRERGYSNQKSNT